MVALRNLSIIMLVMRHPPGVIESRELPDYSMSSEEVHKQENQEIKMSSTSLAKLKVKKKLKAKLLKSSG